MRKIIQIAAQCGLAEENPLSIIALCDDGTLWEIWDQHRGWDQLPGVPQDEKPEAEDRG